MSEQAPKLRGAIVPVTPFQQNCTLLWDDATRRGVVVDPGGDVPTILDGIAQTGVIVERILPSVTALLDGLPNIGKTTAKTGG